MFNPGDFMTFIRTIPVPIAVLAISFSLTSIVSASTKPLDSHQGKPPTTNIYTLTGQSKTTVLSDSAMQLVATQQRNPGTLSNDRGLDAAVSFFLAGKKPQFVIAVAQANTNTATATDSSDTPLAPGVDEKYAEDFNIIKASLDDVLKSQDDWYTFKPVVMKSHHGYHSWPAMAGLAQIYRITNEEKYMDAAVRLGLKWIDSGRLIDDDSYLDWESEGDQEFIPPGSINVEHHEWRAGAGIADILIEINRTGYESVPGTENKFLNFLRREVWEKWQPGQDIQGAGYRRSNIATFGLAFAGRLGIIAMALDRYAPTPGNNQYAEYINSAYESFGILFPTMANLENKLGVAYMPVRTNATGSWGGKAFYDTSHAGDMIYAVARASQLGYDPQGRMEELIGIIERMLNTRIFKTSAGFTEYTDGNGGIDNSNWTSAHGWSMTAGISADLKDRWVDYVRNNDPFFYYVPERKIWMAGGLLWALNGGKL